MRPALARLAPALALIPLAVAAAGASVSKNDAASFQRKLQLINGHALSESRAERKTPVTEAEVNSYLRYDAQPYIPTGVVDPSISILGSGRLSGRAVVDLDAVRKQRSSGGLFDPWSYLGGQLPITATGLLQTREGVGRFELESATISGIPVPKAVLEEVLAYYSRTPDDPDGIDLDDPFDLPARIREIRVGEGQALVIQ